MNLLKKLFAQEQEKPIPELGRNDLCWCGSKKKYKRCHMKSDDVKRAAQRPTRTASS